mgnify:CR=1 FL=1
MDEYKNNITNYKLQYWENDTWKNIEEGTTYGANKVHQFDAIQSTKFRIFIAHAKQAPSIKELKIFKN